MVGLPLGGKGGILGGRCSFARSGSNGLAADVPEGGPGLEFPAPLSLSRKCAAILSFSRRASLVAPTLGVNSSSCIRDK